MKVKEAMNPMVYKISKNESLYKAFKLMKDKGIKRIFVEDNGKSGKIIGVISYRDLVNIIMNKSISELLNINGKIGNIATKEILKINENDDIKDAAKIMVHADITALLVVDNNGACVGVISQTDILRVIVKNNL
ncbi:CBS domain-containing protein [Methanothermococcus okinawensis]|uniref:Signal transduction protein with CBS domains n=1 Tax=Methanothermococcus okinawensis (strain DSM 14208 / JCM 11175 / IH1) TaxID=647113 RepID=F8AKS2_METOI|nr:CBS domain-containing protein [Methanothermococcus okinawensis]AEH06414.1 putative signal transduction protein with CBS domains [Methanothermococcus okinawensis IH1]